MKRRSEDMKKICTRRNKKNMLENRSASIRDVLSSDTAGMKV
jgi:hypothetical protein